MVKKQLLFFGIYLSIIFMVNGCGKSNSATDPQPVDPCVNVSFKFTADVKPIINTTCAISSNCHLDGSTNKGGALTDYNKIFSKRADIKSQVAAGLMPQSGSLTSDQKNKIICWINSGAPNN